VNYQKIYDRLIQRAIERQNLSVALHQYERHHIIPKCLGGDNSKQNIVKLTCEEHFLAHQLLVKIYPENRKLIFAAHAMTISSKKHNRINNKEYAWLKKLKSTEMKLIHTGKVLSEKTKEKMSVAKKGKVSGVNNGFYGKTHTEEYKNKKSELQKIKQLGENNSNVKEWNIKFPDGNINTIKCLKNFCGSLGVTVYNMRANKVDGYEFIGEKIATVRI
jgi:hypothetical protein